MNQKKVLIIGFGISGQSAAAFLLQKGAIVTAVDRKWEALQEKARSLPGLTLGPDDAQLDVGLWDLILLSPGVPDTHPLVQKAFSLQKEVIGEAELAFRYLPNRCIGITGTNGKTTTTLLVTHLLQSIGKKARAVGNNGVSLSSYLLQIDAQEILVVELSSYQLETLQQKKLDCALILNITPDHLDRYGTMQAYAAAKKRIYDCLKPQGSFWISQPILDHYPDLFAPLKPALFDQKPILLPEGERLRQGIPEEQNLQAAFALCQFWGMTQEQFEAGLATFRKPAHRIEWVADIEGVSYFNDSKGTNIDAVMHAMQSFSGPVILLIGGVDKGASYFPWIGSFQGKVKKLLAFGQAAEKMEQELACAFPFQRVETLEEALHYAHHEAKEKDTILLSPGCSSFDQFRSYEHRGDVFKQMVLELKKGN